MSTSTSETLYSLAVIKNPATAGPEYKYYCTETEWRNFTGLTNQNDFPSYTIQECLKNATEQVKKDAFHMMRWELVTKDSNGRYFTQRKYWANRYGAADDGQTQILNGEVTKYDLQIWEADVTSSVASSLWLQGTRINRLMYKIPYEAITEINPLNCYFKLTADYPTVASRQIFATYWAVGKPLEEIGYELRRACIEMVTILAYTAMKTKRLKKGTVSYTLGKQTVTRDEKVFDDMLKQHKIEYEKWIQWFRPFIGRRCKIGRLETEDARQFMNRY